MDPTAATETPEGRSAILSGVLLVVSILLFATAAQKLLSGDDADAPPPKWMATIATMGTGRAFLFGARLLMVNAKFWVFTLSAIIDHRGVRPRPARFDRDTFSHSSNS